MTRWRPGRMRLPALLGGGSGAVICGLCAWSDPSRTLYAYLFAWWFFLGISMGALAVLMIHRVTGGRWGPLVERALAAAAGAAPLLALLFLPILAFQADLYSWVHPVVSEDTAIDAKAWYLNRPFFCVRAVFYFAVWIGLSYRLRRAPETPHDSRSGASLRRASIAGLILYALTMSFASVDWIVSLTPHWYSSSFGLLAVVGQMLGGFAFALVVAGLRKNPAADGDRQHFNDLGNLLLVFVMTWAYLAYTQYLIIWAENLPEEISWYLPRVNTDWTWVGAFLIAFHFALPLFALLFRAVKRNGIALGRLAAGLLLVHLVDAYWLVLPSVDGQGVSPRLADLAAVLCIGGFWLCWVLRLLAPGDRMAVAGTGLRREARHV
jgi:hypothetical protein